ncbi:hypothetical protein LEP1GSC074_3237 [Leptospira noguchii str. Hook]|nr:hypothetical protein LEP1GSC074_3237 [Leptospira noguchii str. Hook]
MKQSNPSIILFIRPSNNFLKEAYLKRIFNRWIVALNSDFLQKLDWKINSFRFYRGRV